MLVFLCFAVNVIVLSSGLHIDEHSLIGTETVPFGFTDKQLGVLRWFSEISSLTEVDGVYDWSGWGEVVHDVHCDGNTCIRYEIAGMAYAAAVAAAVMPLATEQPQQILRNCIWRMIDGVVWQYVELFNDFKSQPTYPDPVAYKNIMYSGHLAQMIVLYEAISGDFSFSTIGWNFSWPGDPTIQMPYNTSKLLEAVRRQAEAYGNGGVPCEPDSIFVICNNFPQNAFALYDAMYGTNVSGELAPVWQKTLERHGVNKLPPASGTDNNYFVLDYLIEPLGIWEPLGSIGSDMWALGWMKPWWISENSSVRNVPQQAYESILSSDRWVFDEAGQLSYLQPSSVSEAVFPFTAPITTSFFPMIYKQFEDDSTVTRELSAKTRLRTVTGVQRLQEVYQYFESSFGRLVDVDGDGASDAYQYNSNKNVAADGQLGNYSIWMTANLFIGMVLPPNDPNFLQNLFKAPPLYLRTSALPKIIGVPYPVVMVSSAIFDPETAYLTFTLVRGDTKSPIDNHRKDQRWLYGRPDSPSGSDLSVRVVQIPWEAATSLVVYANSGNGNEIYKNYTVTPQENEPSRWVVAEIWLPQPIDERTTFIVTY